VAEALERRARYYAAPRPIGEVIELMVGWSVVRWPWGRRLPVVALIVGRLGAAYERRIAGEERLLRRDLPGYTTYSE
jgi:hypothetical protein